MVDKTCDVPVFIDENVARMEIGELETEWPITGFALNIVMIVLNVSLFVQDSLPYLKQRVDC